MFKNYRVLHCPLKIFETEHMSDRNDMSFMCMQEFGSASIYIK